MLQFFVFDDLYLQYLSSLEVIHCVPKNDTHLAHYNLNTHHPIFVLVIFGKDVAERACYQTVVC